MSTFGTGIGEVALIPATGGIFTVHLTPAPAGDEESWAARQILLWDRKAEGGFPEAKILKQRVRNVIEPEKNLGHSDTPSTKAASSGTDGTKSSAKVDTSGDGDSVPANTQPETMPKPGETVACEDCK